MNSYSIVLLGILNIHAGLSEVFSSTEDLKEVVETENVLVGVLERYIRAEKQKIKMLESHVQNQKQEYQTAKQDIEKYVGNPINSFRLIKRLIVDWEHMEIIMGANISKEFLENITLHKQNLKFPKNEDLTGISVALLRLQSTYQINATSMADGILVDQQYNSTLSASDCYQIAREAFLEDEYQHSLLWLQLADIKLRKEPDDFLDQRDILEGLIYAAYEYGYVELAINYTKELLEIDPNHQEILENLALFTEFLKSGRNMSIIRRAITKDEKLSDQLCRNENITPLQFTSKLKCRYINNNNPFLLIAPFKVEQAYLNPEIIIVYDIITEKEIEIIKRLSVPKLERAQVYDPDGELINVSYRVSKSAWLTDDENTYVYAVSKRIADITALSMRTAEDLQILNYGIGGYFTNHWDYYEEELAERHEDGNRIATVLIYMSDVEQGGSTVFPRLKVAVRPKKGTALIWHNLNAYGEVIKETFHTACPVLVGSKWAANKWIHVAGQELLRPKLKNNVHNSHLDKMNIIVAAFLLSMLLNGGSSEVFTSIDDLKDVLEIENNMVGVATGIISLQLTYLINETSIINGQIGGKQYNLTLGGSDCYELGKEAYTSENYYRAFKWLEQANAMLKVKPDMYIDREDVLERLSIAAYRFGYTQSAVNYTQELLELSPTNEKALQNLAAYTEVLESGVQRVPFLLHSEKLLAMGAGCVSTAAGLGRTFGSEGDFGKTVVGGGFRVGAESFSRGVRSGFRKEVFSRSGRSLALVRAGGGAVAPLAGGGGALDASPLKPGPC
ncbi:hypothetical protein ILUMI_25244 [Ignelater luminosus]|uniref:procollagen-proline 4-dioxygenase n=1 Tax=Ignelater luminosus TaxID=2038154 RepID=A0A8K0CC15_IGNLU|nr:hypothetical protein ILUMI_25244 [Ignelater luminosus]